MKNRHIQGAFKMALICSFLIVASIKSCTVAAQNFQRKKTITYIGFDVAFGTRSFLLNSNISRIDRMKVLEEGGSVGFLFGNKIWQTKIRQGFFYSSSQVPYTTDLVETELNVNLNPLQLIRPRFRSIEPYVTVGVERNAVKLYGSYIKNDRSGDTNVGTSLDMQPYLGQIVVTRASVGGGLQYRIPYERSFLRLFAEARYSHVLAHNVASTWFKHTTVSNQSAISLGVSFGYLNK